MAQSMTSLATSSAVLASGRWPRITESPYDGIGGMRIDPSQPPGLNNPGWDVEPHSTALLNVGFVSQLGYRAIWFHMDRAHILSHLEDGDVNAKIGNTDLSYNVLADAPANWNEYQEGVRLAWQSQIEVTWPTATVSWVGDSIRVLVPTTDPMQQPFVAGEYFDPGDLLGIQAEVKGGYVTVFAKPKLTYGTSLFPAVPDNYAQVAAAWKLLRTLGTVPTEGYVELINVAPLSAVHIMVTDIVTYADVVPVGALYAAVVMPVVVP